MKSKRARKPSNMETVLFRELGDSIESIEILNDLILDDVW